MMIEGSIDIALAGLLLATSLWCVAVHRRLRLLGAERADLGEFVTALNAASDRAEAAIKGLRAATQDTERHLKGPADEARVRAGELTRLIDAANRLVKRLEPALHQGARAAAEASLYRGEERRDRPAEVGARAAGRSDQGDENAALRRLLETLR